MSGEVPGEMLVKASRMSTFGITVATNMVYIDVFHCPACPAVNDSYLPSVLHIQQMPMEPHISSLLTSSKPIIAFAQALDKISETWLPVCLVWGDTREFLEQRSLSKPHCSPVVAGC